MKILGLTGSIAMGKSTVARMFAEERIPVFDADGVVHELLRPGTAANREVGKAFPDAVQDGVVDRHALGAHVFAAPAERKRLEAILHPRVAAARGAFLRRAGARRAPLAVLDIPLLFETGGERLCDAVAVVSAPARVQRQRLMARRDMTHEKMEAILASQMPDREKRRRADFVIQTGQSKGETRRQVRRVIKAMKDRPGRAWPDKALARG